MIITREIQGSDSLLPPSHLIGVEEQDGSVPLYWFKPGSQANELAYDDGTKENQFYVCDRWLNNKAAVRMSSPSFPFVLLKSKVLINYQGAENDTTYDFKTSFLISVNRDSSGIPGEGVWGPFSANATGRDSISQDGEWVELIHHLIFVDDSEFWLVFHWKEDSPTAPLIGEDNSTNSGRSFYYALNDYGYFEWKSWSGYNLMIRSMIVTQDSTDTSSSADGFKIYRSKDQGFSSSFENLKDSVGTDQFSYMDYDVENGQTYFYQLTSIYPGEESHPSNEVEVTPKRGADLWLEEGLMEISLDTNQSQLEYLNLSNTGEIPLDFEIKINLSIDGSIRGADNFGYSWTDNRKKQGLEFEWIDIIGSGTLLNQTGHPEYIYGSCSLGFSFPFYGNLFDSLWIMLNGCLSFNSIKLLKWVNDTLPNTQAHLNLIAPFWSNLWFDDSTKIYYYSTSDSFVVSFINIKHFISGSRFTFQTILTENGAIDFQYKKIEDPLTSATLGIQNEDGSCGLLVSCNQGYPEDSLRVKIVLGWIEVEPRKGEILPEQDFAVNLFFNSGFLDSGGYSGNLNIESRDKNHQLEPVDISLILNVESFSDTVSDTTHSDTTIVSFEPKDESAIDFSLQQNYPNPFNTTTMICFRVCGKRKTVNSPIPTSLKIYNIQGELVRILADEKKMCGEHEVIWDGKNQKGKEVASGIYFYRIDSGDFVQTKKMLVLK